MKRVGKPYAVAYGFMLNFKGGFSPLLLLLPNNPLPPPPPFPPKKERKRVYIYSTRHSPPRSVITSLERSFLVSYIYTLKRKKKNKNKKTNKKDKERKRKLSIVTTLLKQEGIKGYKRQMKQRTLLTSLDKPKTICKRFTTITQIPLLE